MMPLSMAKEGEPVVIKKVGGKDETRQFLPGSVCDRTAGRSPINAGQNPDLSDRATQTALRI